MSDVGQLERATQDRVIQLFQNELNYHYLGDWTHRENNRNIETERLTTWIEGCGYSSALINKALRELDQASAIGGGKHLYDANKGIYSLLRYGVKVKEGAGEQSKTVWLIDWENPEKNDFAIAEEVTVKGEHKKRPDIVLYINGIALAVLELKCSRVSVSEGIRQNIDNQKKVFIRDFFTTIQLVMAGNDTEGLRYGVIETPEKHFYQWKEENGKNPLNCLLDKDISLLCNKHRFLEIIHDFIVYDSGRKKLCRHNQFFGVKAAQERVKAREGGIIWHTQGSGKSLTMVWLAKWIRENLSGSRILVITDRTELDDQIEKVFKGVDEDIYRTKSGADLIQQLNNVNPSIICSLVHKFGSTDGSGDSDFIEELRKLPIDFKVKGELFVFVDECHRSQSGDLNKAMKELLPNAMFIGFTGTPLLKKDKRTSIETFGSYIHTYKYNEAVKDGVVLDLRYEARDIDQFLTSEKKVDQWFEAKTRGLSDMAKVQLKQKWGTMQKVLSSQSRLEQIVNDILMDMETKHRLMDGRGNAMLVCSSIYQACKVYELFSKTDFAGKSAIITSYKPSTYDLKGEDSGEGLTEKLHQYNIYCKMLADYFDEPESEAVKKSELFEREVKEKFINHPGQMRLLIVVDKLLTGFDAPKATYLYIDKQMRDHGLFQAICRVNRLDGDDKEYGYIVDYKDLFHNLEGSIKDYTSGAFDGYDKDDVTGLLTDRLVKGKEKLEESREKIKLLCEPVLEPKNTIDYLHYFCTNDTLNKDELTNNEPKRVSLYKIVSTLIIAYADLANEMEAASYTSHEIETIKNEVVHYKSVREEVKRASGDYLDMKKYEPGMRYLLDTYIQALDSEVVSDFEELSLIDLIVNQGLDALDNVPKNIKDNPEAMAETIENNIRKVIIDEKPINPKYYETMSELLDKLIQERKDKAIKYEEYLEKIKELAVQIKNPSHSKSHNYPTEIDTKGKHALYDNLDQNKDLAIRIDQAVRSTKKEGYIGHPIKEREVINAIRKELPKEYVVRLDEIFLLVKNQDEYK